MRCFIALDLPESVCVELSGAIAGLHGHGDVRWVDAAAMHLTLRFLGELDGPQMQAVREAMPTAWPPIRLAIAGLGVFPPRGSLRVVWAGLRGSLEDLAGLAGSLERVALAAGLPAAPRPFHPHVTLGRLRSPRGSGPLAQLVAEMSMAVRSEPFVASAVTMYESELTARGAVYSVLHRVNFGS